MFAYYTFAYVCMRVCMNNIPSSAVFQDLCFLSIVCASVHTYNNVFEKIICRSIQASCFVSICVCVCVCMYVYIIYIYIYIYIYIHAHMHET
jgi:hypothetical protein